MSSKKEEERNEKIIRGLMKLPPNRKCINCNSLGPQYVCTNFWTFVCITCSGIHREFTHRVKSVSMAKFTAHEVEALQKGGNQRARELFLIDWDTQRMRLPDNSNPDKIREFIKNVYVEKKYAGGRSSDKPPRDAQAHKGAEDHRRASSYHSFSQSPPYDHQYEERRYGRQAGMLTRKPGSERGHHEGKISSFMYSPGRQVEQMYEDRFANESSGSRLSDYSVSSTGDPFRFDSQSPNFQESGYGSPPAQVREILAEDVRPQKVNTSTESDAKENQSRILHAHRSMSGESFASSDSNPNSLKSANSGSLIDSVLDPRHASGIHQAEALTFPLSDVSAAGKATNIDLFNQAFVQPKNTYSSSSIDLFGDFSQQPSIVAAKEQNPPAAPLSGNEGWATFDLPQHNVQPFEAKPEHSQSPFEADQGLPPMDLFQQGAPKGNAVLFSSMHSDSDWFPVQNPSMHGNSSVMNDQWSAGLNELKESADSSNLQLWNNFDDSTGKVPQTSSGVFPQSSDKHDQLHRPTSFDPYIGFKDPEMVMFNSACLSPAVDSKAPAITALAGMPVSTFSQSAMPQMGGPTPEKKPTNPFDLLYDSSSEAKNLLLDMGSLQTALPHPQVPAPFLGSLSDPWFPQISSSSFIPSAPQGGLSFIGGQVHSSQLQNIPSQEPVPSLGGNPFA